MATWFPATLQRYRAEHELHLQHVDALHLAERVHEITRQFTAVYNAGQRDQRSYLDIAGETLALARVATLRYAPHTPDPRGVVDGRVALAVRRADELERRGDPLTLAPVDAYTAAAAYATTLITSLEDGETEDRDQALADLQRWLAQLTAIALAIARHSARSLASRAPAVVRAELYQLTGELRARPTGDQGPLASIIISTHPQLESLRVALSAREADHGALLRRSRPAWLAAASDWTDLAYDLQDNDPREAPVERAVAQATERILASRLSDAPERVDLEEVWAEQTLQIALIVEHHINHADARQRELGAEVAIEQLASLLIGLWSVDTLTAGDGP
jgi:hypothetical protein